jgi:hypothetical protein
MGQSIAAFKNNLTKIRTGRANPALLDQVHVDYYGSTVPISQVANVSACSTPAPSACSPGKRAWAPRSRRRSAKAIWG